MALVATALVQTIQSISPATIHEFSKAMLICEPIAFVDLSCNRCGALVNPANHEAHIEWHQDLSLAAFIAVSWRATL